VGPPVTRFIPKDEYRELVENINDF
jgi:hypothetical protein